MPDTPFGKKLNYSVNGNDSIKKLIGKIALEVWEHKSKELQGGSAPTEVSHDYAWIILVFAQ